LTIGTADLLMDSRGDVNSIIQVEEMVSGTLNVELMTVTAGFGTTGLTVTRGTGGDSSSTFTTAATVTRMSVLEILDAAADREIAEFLRCGGKERV
jgi:hypothetical protein